MMNQADLADLLARSVKDAHAALYKLMQQGLVDGAVIPEIQTEAEQAAHYLLGCTNYLALITLYSTAADLRKDEPKAAAVIDDLTDQHLRVLTQAVLLARGPIGAHPCAEGA